ncbi:hypothetical protein N0V82_007676 [Gnomoniopsis sp. IMI 355080]|nr:hypothetical protein N0V82_007676 [Gnomoniopsis sp. IMI 355080]
MSVIEVAVGIIGACLPTLIPVYRKFRYGSLDARDDPNGHHTPYQPGRKNRTTTESLSLFNRVSCGERNPSHDSFSPDGTTTSFDSFEMLSDQLDDPDLVQQIDGIRRTVYHDVEEESSIIGKLVSSPDDEQNNAAHGMMACTYGRGSLDGIIDIEGHT